MRFESRELKPYAEPISKDELVEGATYFFVTFEDDEMLNPSLEPLVFVGRDLEEGDEGMVYFQDLASHRAGAHPLNQDDEGPVEVYCGSENALGHVFQYEQALDQLLACSLRRRGHERRR